MKEQKKRLRAHGGFRILLIHWSILLISATFINEMAAQDAVKFIKVQNNSFEGKTGCCKPPPAWINDGDPGQTPPDVMPHYSNDWTYESNMPYLYNVRTNPAEGKTYLSMSVRSSGTYERVKQVLVQPMLADSCYTFELALCYSNTFVSPTFEFQDSLVPFSNPCLLRIWGQYENKKELLAASPLIDHIAWFSYQFNIQPKHKINAILLEAYYDGVKRYNGNILIDKMSNIYLASCPRTQD